MKPISSGKNPVFRTWADCLESRGIKKHGCFLVSGRKIVPEILEEQPERVQAVIHSKKTAGLPVPSAIDQYQLDNLLFKELDVFGTDFPLLVVSAPEIEKSELKTPNGPTVLCAMGDPANVGALARCAQAFAVKEIVLLKEAASPFHPKAVRASSAAVMKMSFSTGPSVADLSNHECQRQMIVLDQIGEDIGALSWPKDFYLLIGEEGLGIPKNLKAQHHVSIPIANSVESLNAVSAASIALYLNTQSKRR